MIPAHIEHTFRVSDPNPAPPVAMSRYFTVEFYRGGRTYFAHIEACDGFRAALVVLKREGVTRAQEYREISRHEFERLTK